MVQRWEFRLFYVPYFHKVGSVDMLSDEELRRLPFFCPPLTQLDHIRIYVGR